MILVPLYGGGGEEVTKLGENIEEFKNVFEKPNEYLNNRGFVSDKLARDEIIGSLEEEIRKEVDEVLQKEIKNLRYIFTKGKKDKGIPKPLKIKPVKEKFGTGENKLKAVPPEELLSDVRFIIIFRVLSTGFIEKWFLNLLMILYVILTTLVMLCSWLMKK